MRNLAGLTICALIAATMICGESHAVYFVRISDLRRSPTPPNPVKIAGVVTVASPLMVSDGEAEVEVTGVTGIPGDFLIVEGDWDGATLAASYFPGKCIMYASPTMTEMVFVPTGAFLMGNNGEEPYSRARELPQHSVQLSGYWIGKYPVTRAEYRKFIEDGGYTSQSYWSSDGWNWLVSEGRTQPDFWDPVQNWSNPPGEFTQTDLHPVTGISYYEAEAYCNWAGCYLPTEAQWEKAARWDPAAGQAKVYPWGDVWNPDYCNNLHDSLYPGGQTSPVQGFPVGASPYGAQDMAGNIFEWCSDWYSDGYYSETPIGGWIDPQGPLSGDYRTARGGAW